jgi:hypothetical protein
MISGKPDLPALRLVISQIRAHESASVEGGRLLPFLEDLPSLLISDCHGTELGEATRIPSPPHEKHVQGPQPVETVPERKDGAAPETQLAGGPGVEIRGKVSVECIRFTAIKPFILTGGPRSRALLRRKPFRFEHRSRS